MTSPTTTAPHRFCIVNCYPAASRDNFDRSDVGHPHDLFKDFLRREAPNASSEIVYVADPGFALPPGTSIGDFDGFIWTGSDLTVYNMDDPRVAAQISFARALMREGAVSWGSCWGLQLASLVAGGEVEFGSVFTMSTWTRLPMAVYFLVQAVFMVIAQRALNAPGLSSLVATGDLMKDAQNPLFTLLGRLDPFWLWHLFLVVVGLSVAARFSRVKSLVLTLVYVVVSLAVTTLPTLLFGGLAGG